MWRSWSALTDRFQSKAREALTFPILHGNLICSNGQSVGAWTDYYKWHPDDWLWKGFLFAPEEVIEQMKFFPSLPRSNLLTYASIPYWSFFRMAVYINTAGYVKFDIESSLPKIVRFNINYGLTPLVRAPETIHKSEQISASLHGLHRRS